MWKTAWLMQPEGGLHGPGDSCLEQARNSPTVPHPMHEGSVRETFPREGGSESPAVISQFAEYSSQEN